MDFGAKVTLCRGHDKRMGSLRMWLPFVLACPCVSVCVCVYPYSFYNLPSPILCPPRVCLPSHIFMHFLSGHFYARTRFPLDVNGCHFLARLFDFRQWFSQRMLNPYTSICFPSLVFNWNWVKQRSLITFFWHSLNLHSHLRQLSCWDNYSLLAQCLRKDRETLGKFSLI